MVADGGGMHGCWWACVVARGCMVAEGHVWLLGGMHGCPGCVVAGGHAWFWGGHVWLLGAVYGSRGTCMVAMGGMHDSRGACMVAGGCAWLPGGGACIGYDEIWSISGRYASYWNAFLFLR